jgi:hypothetical protein
MPVSASLPCVKYWLVLAVVLAVVALGPLAYSSPPDQTWLTGLWDNGDYDDVVILATSTAGVAAAVVVTQPRPVLLVVARIAPVEPVDISSPAVDSPATRAPPTV